MHEKYKITSALLMIYLCRYEYRQVYYPTTRYMMLSFKTFLICWFLAHWKMFSHSLIHTRFSMREQKTMLKSTEEKISNFIFWDQKNFSENDTLSLFPIICFYYIFWNWKICILSFFSYVVDFYQVRKCFEQFFGWYSFLFFQRICSDLWKFIELIFSDFNVEFVSLLTIYMRIYNKLYFVKLIFCCWICI